jgi:hypothetical protein
MLHMRKSRYLYRYSTHFCAHHFDSSRYQEVTRDLFEQLQAAYTQLEEMRGASLQEVKEQST